MVEAIQNIIKEWLAGRKHRSLKQLSEESGLNYGTIRNMADGKAVPNGETILRLLLVTLSVEAMHEFVCQHLPHLSPYTNVIQKHGSTISKTFAITRKHAAIMLEVSFGKCHREHLKTKFGPSSDRIIEELLNEEILVLIEDHYQFPSKDVFVPTEAFGIEISKLIQDNIDISLKGNLIHAQSASLSIEAVREVYQLMEKTRNELFEIFKNPKNAGETKVALSLAMTLF